MRFINIIMVFGIMTPRDFKFDLGVCLPNDFSSMLHFVFAKWLRILNIPFHFL